MPSNKLDSPISNIHIILHVLISFPKLRLLKYVYILIYMCIYIFPLGILLTIHKKINIYLEN